MAHVHEIYQFPLRAPSRAQSRASTSRPGTKGRRSASPLVAPVEKAKYSLKLTFEQDTSYLWLQSSTVEEKLSNEKLVDRHYSACKMLHVLCCMRRIYIFIMISFFDGFQHAHLYVSNLLRS